jgi:hypothetical protein
MSYLYGIQYKAEETPLVLALREVCGFQRTASKYPVN